MITDYMTVFKLQHVACGVYIWEWAMNLGYELDFVTGKRPWKHTLLPYLLCRYSILATVINLLLALNARSLECHVWVKFEILLPYTGLLMASVLIIMRTVAIWNRHPAMVALSAAGILAQLALLIHSVALASNGEDSRSGMTGEGCVAVNMVPASLPALAATFAIDTLLLLLMLFGLILRRDAKMFGIWRFLLKQGLLWLALAIAAELPTMIILRSNMNDALHQMFIAPEVIILTIAATNMYRTLTNFSVAQSTGPMSSSKPLAALTGRSTTSHNREINTLANSMQPRAVEVEVHVERDTGDGTRYGFPE